MNDYNDRYLKTAEYGLSIMHDALAIVLMIPFVLMIILFAFPFFIIGLVAKQIKKILGDKI